MVVSAAMSEGDGAYGIKAFGGKRIALPGGAGVLAGFGGIWNGIGCGGNANLNIQAPFINTC